jgi:hypothetical protein
VYSGGGDWHACRSSASLTVIAWRANVLSRRRAGNNTTIQLMLQTGGYIHVGRASGAKPV